jgi:hypothetical protein
VLGVNSEFPLLHPCRDRLGALALRRGTASQVAKHYTLTNPCRLTCNGTPDAGFRTMGYRTVAITNLNRTYLHILY